MMADMENRSPLNEMLRTTLDRVREMADTNTVVGEPIATPDGVTLIPISKISIGFGGGGGNYGKTQPQGFGGGSGVGMKIDPVAFLVIRDGVTRVLPVAVPPVSTLDRVVDMVPGVLDRVENFFDRKEEKEQA